MLRVRKHQVCLNVMSNNPARISLVGDAVIPTHLFASHRNPHFPNSLYKIRLRNACNLSLDKFFHVLVSGIHIAPFHGSYSAQCAHAK